MWKFNLIKHTNILFTHLRKKMVEPHRFRRLFTVQTWLLFDAAALEAAK